MPRRCEWLTRLPEIRAELEQIAVPVVDRTVFEALFRVRRRRAIQLLHYFGGFQSGKTFLIDRAALLGELAKLEASGDVQREYRRKERLVAKLEQVREQARASRVAVRTTPEIYSTRLNSLPEGVRLGHGELTIRYSSSQELLERLFALAQALANDLDRLQTLDEEAEVGPADS